jgi:hypothetical protein
MGAIGRVGVKKNAAVSRRITAVVMSTLLALPPNVSSAPLGTLKGTITLQGRPLSGIRLALVDLESGAVHRVTSGDKGQFEAAVAPGRYVVSAEGQGGIVVAEAPTQVPVVAGRIALAKIDLAPLQIPQAGTAPPPPTGDKPITGKTLSTTEGQTTLTHEGVTCFIAGEFPLLDATLTPAATVARARIYFKSALVSNYYYIEMTPAEGKFVGKLPRPRVEASPVTYYVQATTTDFAEMQLQEVPALVVEKREDCPDDKIAAIGPPGEVTVFSAATGLAIAPAGFAAGAVGLLGLGGLALLLGGAAAAGVLTTAIVFPPDTPPPTVPPTPEPTPTPEPPPPPAPTATPTDAPTPDPGPTPPVITAP